MTGEPRRIVVAGVSGVGKSTIAQHVSRVLALEYRDADDLHPPGSVQRMAAGVPLSDLDREPWLHKVGDELRRGSPGMVVACSALKRRYRDTIRSFAPDAYFLLLVGPRDVIEARMAGRADHFMPPALLQSQLEILEPLEADEIGMTLDVTSNPYDVAGRALEEIGAVTRLAGARREAE